MVTIVNIPLKQHYGMFDISKEVSTLNYMEITFTMPSIFLIPTDILIIVGPINTTATAGDAVPFNCNYTGTDNLPFWRINGVVYSPSALPPGYMANKTGLYFTTFQELHLSTYQCFFAFYNDLSESIEVVESATGELSVMQGQLQ